MCTAFSRQNFCEGVFFNSFVLCCKWNMIFCSRSLIPYLSTQCLIHTPCTISCWVCRHPFTLGRVAAARVMEVPFYSWLAPRGAGRGWVPGCRLPPASQMSHASLLPLAMTALCCACHILLGVCWTRYCWWLGEVAKQLLNASWSGAH